MFSVYVYIQNVLFWKLYISLSITCSWLIIYLLTEMYSMYSMYSIVVVIPENMTSKHSSTVSCRFSYIHYTDAYQSCLYRCAYTFMTVCMCTCKPPWLDLICLKTCARTVWDKMKHITVVQMYLYMFACISCKVFVGCLNSFSAPVILTELSVTSLCSDTKSYKDCDGDDKCGVWGRLHRAQFPLLSVQLCHQFAQYRQLILDCST